MSPDHGTLIINGVDHSQGFNAVLIYVFLGLATLNLFFPRCAWPGWRYDDDAEPSDTWPLLVRFTCLIVILCLLFRLNHDGAADPILERVLKFLPKP